MAERWIVKCDKRYYVGVAKGAYVWASRSYFANRFNNADAARGFIREKLADFGGAIDSCHVVRLNPRAPASAQ